MSAFTTRAPKITSITISGSQTALEGIAGDTLGGQRAVYLDSAGLYQYASNTVLEDSLRTIGITLNAAAVDEVIAVQTFGQIEEPSWSWDLDLPIYLGANGILTQTPPVGPSALFQRILGFPLSSTSMFLSMREPIVLAL